MIEVSAARTQAALDIGLEFGQIDGAHHKQWVIDQMIRALTGDQYHQLVGDDWDTGTAP